MQETVLSVLPFPALEQALSAQLEPACSAGEALHAVCPFAGPARAVAWGAAVSVLIGEVALWTAVHAGGVCGVGRKAVLTPSLEDCTRNETMGLWPDGYAGSGDDCPGSKIGHTAMKRESGQKAQVGHGGMDSGSSPADVSVSCGEGRPSCVQTSLQVCNLVA